MGKGLKRSEMRVMDRLADAYDMFAALPELHPADDREFRFHVHALQNMVLARVAVRHHPVELVGPNDA